MAWEMPAATDFSLGTSMTTAEDLNWCSLLAMAMHSSATMRAAPWHRSATKTPLAPSLAKVRAQALPMPDHAHRLQVSFNLCRAVAGKCHRDRRGKKVCVVNVTPEHRTALHLPPPTTKAKPS